MYGDNKLILGYAPIRRDFFPDPAQARIKRDQIRQRFDKIIGGIDNLEVVNIDWLNEDGLLYDAADVKRVEDHFKKAGVDAIFIPHCNFGQEEAVGKLGSAMNKPLLLWGPRDDAPPKGLAQRQTDTQCGLFASSRALCMYGVPYTYIENCWLDSEILDKGFNDFIRVSSVVKAFKHMRVGQVLVRPRQFLSVKINEIELIEKFGIEVVAINGMEIISMVKDILSNKKDKVKEITDDITQKIDCSAMFDEKAAEAESEMINGVFNTQGLKNAKIMESTSIERIAALELALMEAARRYELDAIASDCWMLYTSMLGIRPCFVFGDTTDRGLPVTCETDVYGSITSVILTAAARGETPGFIADMTIRHPENDNAELLWHCGPFPKSLVKQGVKPVLISCHGQWEIKGGDITIARFGSDRGKYKLFAGQAKGVDGPSTDGNYIWVETDNWVKWEKKLISGPYIHHVAGIHGEYAGTVHEACKYLTGLEPDFV